MWPIFSFLENLNLKSCVRNFLGNFVNYGKKNNRKQKLFTSLYQKLNFTQLGKK